MQDVLGGGILETTSIGRRSYRRKLGHSAGCRHASRRPRNVHGRLVATTHKVTVQPGQLSSPLIKYGFPSLSVH